MMQRILKGDTSGTIALALADGYNYAGCVVEFRYQGAVRTFHNCEVGQTVQFNFTAAETAVMALGAFPVTVRLFTPDGRFFTVNNADVKIEVTDCVADVREGGVIVVEAQSGLYGVDDLPERYTTKDIREKINEIITRLGGGVATLCLAACVACGSLFGAGVTVQKANLEDINNDDEVVTGVTFSASGLATEADVTGAEIRAKAYADDAVSNGVAEAFAAIDAKRDRTDRTWIDDADSSIVFTVSDAKLNGEPVPSLEGDYKFNHVEEFGLAAWFISTNSPTPQVSRNEDGFQWIVDANGACFVGLGPHDLRYDASGGAGEAVFTAHIEGVRINDTLAIMSEVRSAIAGAGHATAADLAPINTKVEQSLIYSSGIYQYMAGNTNAWFSATNYVTTADGTTRTRFAWEEGMDTGTVPPSMSLWEIRDGQKTVWDQRDWTVWYWSFKSAQLSNNLARVTGELASEVSTNCMRRGWAKYTAVRGLDNPDPSILWIDTPKVQLMAGHQWEKIVEVGGAGYWTLTGNGIELSQQDAESTFLTIKDFEGNACITFRKSASYLVYCETGTDIVSTQMDAQGRAVFHLTTDVQPTAEFSTTLELDSFVEQGADGCPANYEWTGSAGSWDCHFILKPGITSSSCFARFKSLHEGENVVEHTVPIKLNGGIVFEQDGVTRKIRPTISGSTVTWVVAQ